MIKEKGTNQYSSMIVKNLPFISVIIPNRNRTVQLFRCIDSVKNQTYKCWEIIIVDDSDEQIFRQIQDLYRNALNISVYRGDNNSPASAQCKGFTVSKGECVAFLDSDDYWEPTKLEKHASIFARDADIAVSWDDLLVEKINGEIIKVAPINLSGLNGVIPQNTILKALLKENFIHMSCGIVRKKSIIAINGPFPESPFDYVLWINMAVRNSFIHLKEYLTIKSEGPDELSYNKRVLFKENWNITRLKLKVLLKNRKEFSPAERISLLIRIVLISLGIQIFLPHPIRKFFRPIIFLNR